MSTRHKRQSRRSNLSYFVTDVGATKLRMIINSASIRIPARVSIRAVVQGHTAQQRYLADASCRTCEPLFYPERNWVNGLSKEKEKEREREKERNNGIRLLLLPSLYSRNWNIRARFAALAYGYADYRHRFTGAVTDQRSFKWLAEWNGTDTRDRKYMTEISFEYSKQKIAPKSQ